MCCNCILLLGDYRIQNCRPTQSSPYCPGKWARWAIKRAQGEAVQHEEDRAAPQLALCRLISDNSTCTPAHSVESGESLFGITCPFSRGSCSPTLASQRRMPCAPHSFAPPETPGRAGRTDVRVHMYRVPACSESCTCHACAVEAIGA